MDGRKQFLQGGGTTDKMHGRGKKERRQVFGKCEGSRRRSQWSMERSTMNRDGGFGETRRRRVGDLERTVE